MKGNTCGYIRNETPEKIRNSREHQRDKITGGPLQEIALFILHKLNLVPEHVETRRLYPTLGGKLPCGEVRMFVDLFPIGLGPIPPPLDISPRQPERYQLRIALFNVASAIPVKRSFGEPVNNKK
uniref:DUF4158 domain-containing protein n=1 Tax=Heterorhabditis bacteriophora TaxID=37862 RepID=A0A1I7XPM7_HETBA